MAPSTNQLRVVVLASHGGTNLQAIIDACKSGQLDAEVCAVISNNSTSMALERADKEGIPGHHISRKTHPDPNYLDKAIIDIIESSKADIVVLAGYMRPLGPTITSRYAGRILNCHPALLPKFGGKGMYGAFVHRAVLEAGERITGVTIHMVDDEYDHGPTVAQTDVPVLEGDTVESLTERVQEREHKFWIETLQKLASGQINLNEIRTPVSETS